MSTFTVTSNATAAAAVAAPTIVPVLDPTFRSGLLQIPMDRTLPTLGRDEWLEGRLRNKDLSLCCLFQKGRCHAGERCHQVHVEREFVVLVREHQKRIVSCCSACGDTATLAPVGAAFFAQHVPAGAVVHLTAPTGGFNSCPASALAYTSGLVQQFCEHGCRAVGGVIAIPARRACRLHLRGVCKYGRDCKNVHVCSQLGEAFLNIAAPLVSVAAAPTAAAFALPLPSKPVEFGLFERCAPQPRAPVATAAAPAAATVVVAVPPLSGFSSAAAVSAASNPLGLAERGSVNAASGSHKLLASLCFNAERALEASALSDDDDDTPSKQGFSYFSSPASTRRGSNGSQQQQNASPHVRIVKFDSTHPCAAPSAAAPASALCVGDAFAMDFARLLTKA